MRFVRRARDSVNGVLRLVGQQIVPTRKVASPAIFFDLLRRHGLAPRTVFDIGVAAGTPWLYAAFPDARFVLVDPSRESLPHMRRWAERLDAQVLNLALGAEETTMRLRVGENIERASLHEEAEPLGIVAEYDVRVRRLDTVIDDFERPALCKIDAQGGEIEVLRGMGRHLTAIDAFIIETSLLAPFHDSPELLDLVRLMDEQGYVLHDIVGTYRRQLDLALAQIDAAFVPRGSPLRCERRWA
jgi:FkbM family methyltransferase